MRRWRVILFVGLCLICLPILAVSDPPSALPQDFLATFQEVDAAYGRKDLEGILRSYDPHCTFIVVTEIHDFHLEHKDAQHKQDAQQKRVKDNIKVTHQRHDVAWQRQDLQRLFFVTFQALDKTSSLPLQNTHVTSDIQQSAVNRKATEVRLTIDRKIRLDQGQAQTIRPEVDEEVWVKGAQGWKLKQRTISHPKVAFTDVS